MAFKSIAPMWFFSSLALAAPSGTSPGDAEAPKEAGHCDTLEVEYAIAANLQVKGTMMGAGNGVHKVGPGRLVLRLENHGGQEVAKILSYELRQRFVVSAKTVFGGAIVITDVVTQGTPSVIAEGMIRANSILWEGPPQGLHSDGTLTCDGSLCGKFGTPPQGSSEVHTALIAAQLQPFLLSSDRKTFTMPSALMSKSDSPKQETLVAVSGRELRSTCLDSR